MSWHISKGCSCLSWCRSSESGCPSKAIPQLATSGFCGHEPHWSWKPGILGAHLSSGDLKSWVGRADVGYESFASWRSSRLGLLSQLWITPQCVGNMAVLCLNLSYSLWCGFPLVYPMGGGYFTSSFFFPSEEIIPYPPTHTAIDLVCLSEKVSSWSSYIAILNGN